MWSRDGRELFFENPDRRIVAVGYKAQSDSFAAEKPRIWSEKQLYDFSTRGNAFTTARRNVDVAPDAKRFIVILPYEDPSSQQSGGRVHFVENFFDELRRRVPVTK